MQLNLKEKGNNFKFSEVLLKFAFIVIVILADKISKCTFNSINKILFVANDYFSPYPSNRLKRFM